MITHVGAAIARILTPGGRYAFHPVEEHDDPQAVQISVGVCGRCGTSPGSAVARCCTSSRCPLIKSDYHHSGSIAA